MRDLGTRHRRYFRSVAVVSVLAFVAIACTQGSSNNSSQQPSNQPQTIVFATQGLGSEGSATKAAITAFEAANPSITVQVQTLSPTANTAQQQLTQRFVAGDTTPDVITADVIWPAAFAKAGWLAPLDGFGPSLDSFFPGQVQSGQYGGHTYAIPWFINAEGLYYRTDLVPSPPKTPMDVV
ncbi:MAG: extracellular solute-binding protein, partial [Actinobacteria bacterium]